MGGGVREGLNVRFSRRAKRRIIVLAASVAVLGASVVVFKLVRSAQQARLMSEARVAGLSAYEDGRFDTALERLGYVIQHDKDDAEVILAFADARARTPMPNSKHVFEALNYYKAGVDLLEDPTVAVPESMDRDAELYESWSRMLELYRVHGMKFEVKQTAQKLLAHDPDDVEALIALVQMQYLDREFGEAIRLTERLIELQPEKLKWRKLYLAMMLQSGRGTQDLLQQCERWLETDATDGRYYALKAAALHDGGHFLEAKDAARRAAELGADALDVLQEMVSLLDAFGLNSVADKLVERTSAEHPDAQWVQLAIVRRYWQANKVSDALARIHAAERRFDELDPEMIKLKALALSASGEPEQAIAALKPLTRADDHYDRESEALRAWANAVIARISGEQHTYEEVVRLAEHALVQDPRDSVMHTILGETYSKMGEDALAVQHFERAYELDPSWIAAGVTYVDSLLRAGRTVDAYLIAAQVLQRRPTDMLPPYMLCARAYLDLKRAGQFDDVAAMGGPNLDIPGILEVIYEQVPDDPAVSGLLAEAYVVSGRTDLARQFMDAVLHADDTSAEALLELAKVSRRYDVGSEAALIERAAALDSKAIDVALARADLLARKGQFEQGLDVLDQAIEQAPAQEAQSFEVRRARTSYLLRINDSGALDALRGLVEDFSERPEAQSFALAQARTWTDQKLVRQVIDRLGELVGGQSQQVRLAQANFLLRFQADDEADLAKAIVLINGVIEESPDSLAALTLLANASLLGERPSVERAVTHLQRAIERYPNATSLYPPFIELLQQQGDYGTAERYLDRFARLAEQQPQWKEDEVRLLRAQGDFEKALVKASTLIDEQSGETDQLALADMYRRSGRPNEAQAIYDRLLAEPQPSATVIERAAEFYAVTGRRDRARALLSGYEPRAGNAWRKALLLGRFETKYGDESEALQHLQRAAELQPDSAEAQYELARFELNQSMADAALESAKQGLRHDPEHRGLRAILALASLKADPEARRSARQFWDELGSKGDALDATLALLQSVTVRDGTLQPTQRDLDDATALIGRHGGFLPAWMLCMSLQTEAGQTNEAIDTARRAVGRFPANAQVAQWATSMLMGAERWSEALAEAQEWRRRSLDDPIDADVAMATIMLELNRPADALKQLEGHADRIMAQRNARPHRVGPWMRALLATDQYERASTLATEMVSESPRWRRLWMELAAEMSEPHAYEALSAVEAAATDAMEFLELAVAWNRLGQRSNELSSFARADALAERASEMDASLHVQVLITRGLIAEGQGDLVKAERYYRQVIDADPDNTMTLNNLAYLLVRNGRRYEQALPLVERALKLAPGHPAVLDTYGQVLTGLGRLDDAQQAFTDARRKRPRDMEIALNLAEVMIERGSLRDASFVLDDVREEYELSWPKDAEVSQRMERLRNRINDQVGQAGS